MFTREWRFFVKSGPFRRSICCILRLFGRRFLVDPSAERWQSG
jgi:hypothetical protein